MIDVGAMCDGTFELRFCLPLDHPGRPIGVAGDFNDWAWEQTPFRVVHGQLIASTVVTASGRYEFRYRTADDSWFNDDQAGDYVPNEFGGCNCLVDVPAPIPPPAPEA